MPDSTHNTPNSKPLAGVTIPLNIQSEKFNDPSFINFLKESLAKECAVRGDKNLAKNILNMEFALSEGKDSLMISGEGVNTKIENSSKNAITELLTAGRKVAGNKTGNMLEDIVNKYEPSKDKKNSHSSATDQGKHWQNLLKNQSNNVLSR